MPVYVLMYKNVKEWVYWCPNFRKLEDQLLNATPDPWMLSSSPWWLRNIIMLIPDWLKNVKRRTAPAAIEGSSPLDAIGIYGILFDRTHTRFYSINLKITISSWQAVILPLTLREKIVLKQKHHPKLSWSQDNISSNVSGMIIKQFCLKNINWFCKSLWLCISHCPNLYSKTQYVCSEPIFGTFCRFL